MQLKTYFKLLKFFCRQKLQHNSMRFAEVIERYMLPAPHTGVKTGNVILNVAGCELDCVWNPPASPEDWVILYSHGNGEYLATFDWWREEFQQHGYGFFGYDYEAYGGSTGSISENNMCRDVEAAYAFLTETAQISPSRIIILGYSMGSVPSCHIATLKPALGLVLCAPIASGNRLALPFSLFNDCFYNLRRVKKISMPTLIVHGDADNIVPPANGRILFRKTAAPNKKFFCCRGAGHNDLFERLGEGLWYQLEQFAQKASSY